MWFMWSRRRWAFWGISNGSLSFAASPGTLPAPQPVQITSTFGTLAYTVAVEYSSLAPGNWIGISSTGGSTSADTPATLAISVTNVAESFPPGNYTAAVTVTAGQQVQTVTVTLTVGTSLNVPSVMVFGAIAGMTAPIRPQDLQTLLVGAVGAPVPFTYTITPQITPGGPSSCPNSSVGSPSRESSGWLIINGSPNFGSGTTGEYLAVSVQPAGLAPGTYVDTISFFVDGSFTTTQVYLVVENPTGNFYFNYTMGGAAPAQLNTIALVSECVPISSLVMGYSSDQQWLSATFNPAGGQFFVSLSASPYGLPPGTYYGAVAVTDTAGEVWVFPSSLTISPPLTTTTSLAVSPNPAVSGQSVALIATVSPVAASGSVTFYDGGVSLGNLPLSGGAATISLSFAPGTHVLTAVYPGNNTYPASASGPVNLQVTSALQATTTSLSAVPSPQSFGSPLTLTATVSPSSATGTVTFFDGTTQLGLAQVSGGAASVSISTLTVGGHILTANYGGDAGDSPSVSSPVSVNIIVGPQPVILTGGIVNAASFAAVNGVGIGGCAGSLVAIFTSTLMTQGRKLYYGDAYRRC